MKAMKKTTLLLTLLTVLAMGHWLCAQPHSLAKPQAPAMEVKMVQAGEEVALPAEFQVALYEDLIQELQNKGVFRQIYRDGDRDANDLPDLITLQTTITAFNKGSELKRDVIHVAGATSMTVRCQFATKDGKVLLQRDIQGKVRLMGDNLKATDDFAKKAATVVQENLSSDSIPPDSNNSVHKR